MLRRDMRTRWSSERVYEQKRICVRQRQRYINETVLVREHVYFVDYGVLASSQSQLPKLCMKQRNE